MPREMVILKKLASIYKNINLLVFKDNVVYEDVMILIIQHF